MKRLRLHFAADLEAASHAGAALGQWLGDHYGTHAAGYALELAVAELLSNIVRHNPSCQRVSLRAAGNTVGARVVLFDDGKPFDMTRVEATLPTDPLAESGRGLWLVRQGVDAFCYTRRNGQNVHAVFKPLT